jgi:hypothetical protein
MARMNPPLFRALYRAIPLDKRCSASCPGWVCGPSGVARCDECWAHYAPAVRPTDADAANLPEARQRMRLALHAMRRETGA